LINMQSLFSKFPLKGLKVKNRIVFPPIVCFNYAGEDGIVTTRNIEHYRQMASGGAGIIITEATAVSKDGRLAPFQLGIWSDEHIAGMEMIATAVKDKGAVSLLQIHHAGLLTHEKASPVAKAPSIDPNNPRSRELTTDEIIEIIEAFIEAAARALKAGYHGVELHGAHGYLLNQFASGQFNKRVDEYGGSLERNMKPAIEIIRGIRKRCGREFIIGYRLGVNSPTLEDGIMIAKLLEQEGVDLIHVSHGGSLLNLPRPPKDFEYNWIVYSGTVIKTHLNIPVIVVNEIKTPERANGLIENNLADFVALGRPQMADPEWANHVKNHEKIIPCLSCKPKCRWYEDSALCPARKGVPGDG
jgi:2,4-dienoyl-CoA reductase-like NADH-dependent reductase (Old Yellow Enzyme family)